MYRKLHTVFNAHIGGYRYLCVLPLAVISNHPLTVVW